MAYKILMIDNDTELPNMIKQYFEMEKYEIVTAGNGSTFMHVPPTVPAPQKKMKQLSKGMKRRAGLILALLNEPELQQWLSCFGGAARQMSPVSRVIASERR